MLSYTINMILSPLPPTLQCLPATMGMMACRKHASVRFGTKDLKSLQFQHKSLDSDVRELRYGFMGTWKPKVYPLRFPYQLLPILLTNLSCASTTFPSRLDLVSAISHHSLHLLLLLPVIISLAALLLTTTTSGCHSLTNNSLIGPQSLESSIIRS